MSTFNNIEEYLNSTKHRTQFGLTCRDMLNIILKKDNLSDNDDDYIEELEEALKTTKL